MQENKLLEENYASRITVHVATRDRHSEMALLLQSLRGQTYQEYDVIILDDASGTPLTNCHFFMALFNRMMLEGHRMRIIRNPYSKGVCNARNTLIDNDDYGNPLVCRLDDDVILEPEYFDKLLEVLDEGYDLASGVVPLLAMPEYKRETRFVGKVINEHELDKEGNLVKNNDDCGYAYLEEKILTNDQFRTNCLYRKEVTGEGVRYPDFLSPIGFREELFFSFQAIIKGFKLGVNTCAVAYHLQTPSGGCRSLTYAEDVRRDDETARAWVKKQFEVHGDFLSRYHNKKEV